METAEGGRLRRWLQASSAVGGVVWLVLWFVPVLGDGDMGTITRLLLLAILVCVPLALLLVETPYRDGRHPWPHSVAVAVQPVAAAMAVGSFLVPSGVVAGALAAGWFAVTALAGLFGVFRFLTRGTRRVEETVLDAGLIYLPVGGAWLVVSRLALNPLGFGDMIVLLTAVHFHYAGFIAPVLAGLAGRHAAREGKGRSWVYPFVCGGLIAGPPLVALGITLSPLVEVVAVFLQAGSLVLFALWLLFGIVPTMDGVPVKLALAVSAISVMTAMGFAAAYGLGEFVGREAISISRMVQVHGWLNAAGFALCGLLAWLPKPPKTLSTPPGTPFSRFAAMGRVGPGFFHSVDAVPEGAIPPRGLVENLAEYDGSEFQAARGHTAVGRFMK